MCARRSHGDDAGDKQKPGLEAMIRRSTKHRFSADRKRPIPTVSPQLGRLRRDKIRLLTLLQLVHLVRGITVDLFEIDIYYIIILMLFYLHD